MIPIEESVAVRRRPWITGALLVLCVLIFLYELTLPSRALDLFIQHWGAHPQTIVRALGGNPRVSVSALLTLITSQFLHAGWLHLIGNMAFLWVFGRAVEYRFGHLPYLILYLFGGAFAAVAQSVMSLGGPDVPMIGASGAIATVLGAYLILFPTAWVSLLVPIFFFFWTIDVPALLVLPFWFVSQFFTGVAAISQAAAPGSVAVWAHVAGFLLGMAVGLVGRATGLARRGSPVLHRADGPGPAGLVASLANLAVLLLAVRVILGFIVVVPRQGLLHQIASWIFAITNPVVGPLEHVIPPLLFLGRPLDLAALVVLLLIVLLSGLLVDAIADLGAPQVGMRNDWS